MGLFGGTTQPAGKFRIQKTDADWRRQLSASQYEVLRKQGTERPNSSPLNKVKQPGVFRCAGCAWPLYATKDKFESGTGWPSFTRPINNKAVGTSVDRGLFMVRTEVHCANCGGHIGHVFPDGPPPTGQRYCINSVSMQFFENENDIPSR